MIQLQVPSLILLSLLLCPVSKLDDIASPHPNTLIEVEKDIDTTGQDVR